VVDNVITTQNYIITVTTASYTVDPRQISVTFNDNISSVYGDGLLSVEDIIKSCKAENGTHENALVELTIGAVFAYTGTKNDDATVTLAKFAPVGKYTVTLTVKNGNFQLVNGDTTDYEITPATITYSGFEGYQGTYDGTQHNILKYDYNVVLVGDNTYTLQYKDSNGDWVNYIVDGKAAQIKDVNQSGKYNFQIVADNHTTVQFDVTVDIIKATLYVTMNFTINFGEKSPVEMNYKTALTDLFTSSIYTITDLLGDDKTVTDYVNGLDLGGTFTYSTDYTQGSSANGDYYLTFDGRNLTSTNYVFANASDNNGKLTVVPLKLTVTATNMSVEYGTDESDVTVSYSDISVTFPASSYNGSQLTISDLAIDDYKDIFVLSTNAFENGKTKGVGTYAITCKLNNGKENDYALASETIGSIEVTKATNTFTTPFGFVNKAEYTEDQPKQKDAWVYGPYSDAHLLGYNANGNQQITEPVVKFNEVASNKIAVELYFNGSLKSTKVYNTVTDMFNDMDPATFGAGQYYIVVTLAGNANYSDLTGKWYFDVSKKDITIKANSIELTYGDNAPSSYKYTAQGLVNGDTTASILDLTVEYFKSDYAPGWQNGSVGTHGITHNGTTAPVLDNYNVTEFIGNDITVKQRNVTITVEDKTVTYGDKNLPQLTFVITDGSFYSGDVIAQSQYTNSNGIITLYTKAIKEDGTTNDVIIVSGSGNSVVIGGYAIYAKYNSIEDNGELWSKNYVIEFANCSDKYGDDDCIKQGDVNNAGLYKINQAPLSVELLGLHHREDGKEVQSNYYSGAENYYKASVGGSLDKVDFTYEVATDNSYSNLRPLGENEKLINVGFYTVTAVSKDSNYTAGSFSARFSILKSTLTLTADNGLWVQYGTTLAGNEGVSTLNGRFSGFTYTADSDTILQTVYEEYLNGKVTFTTNYTATTNVGANCTITPKCEGNDNINIELKGTAFTVVKRQVLVTIKGWSDNTDAWIYYCSTEDATSSALTKQFNDKIDNFISFSDGATVFGASGDNRSKLGISLSWSDSNVNAGQHSVKIVIDPNTNYDVTLTNDTDEIAFTVKKAPLIITATVNGNYTVTYGNDIAYGSGVSYKVESITGEAVDDNVLFDLSSQITSMQYTYTKQGEAGKAYAKWATKVGAYTVTVNEINAVFDNYELSTANGAKYISASTKLNVVPRPINVTVANENQIFDWDGSDYHGGAYGKAHEAQLTFRDILTADSVDIRTILNSGDYKVSGTTITYSTQKNTSINQLQDGCAPTVVGNYTITVTLNDANYTFVNGDGSNTNIKNNIAFNVIKRKISETDLAWKFAYIKDDETEPNEISKFIKDIMNVVLFQFTPNGANESITVTPGDKDTAYTYYFIDQVLAINASEMGKYEVTIQLKDTATQNYEFDTSSGAVIVSSFVITSLDFSMTLEITDWTYGDTPNAPVAEVNGNSYGITFTYSRVTNLGNMDVHKSFDNLNDFVGATYDSFVNINYITFNAGYYIVCAHYNGTQMGENGTEETVIIDMYYVFCVDTKKIDAPVSKFNDNGYTFNGTEQRLEIEYDTSIIRVSYDGHTGTSETGIFVFATDAGNHYVTFRLLNNDNYEWSTEANAENGVVTITWNIAIDSDDNATEIVDVTDKNTATFGNVSIANATVKEGYDGYITIWWTKDDGQPGDDTANVWTEWSKALPANAGNYHIKLVLSDNGKNYADKVVYTKLTIDPKRITVTVSGSVTYGDRIADGNIGVPVVNGLLYGNKWNNVDGVTQLTYVVTDANGNVLTYDDVLYAGGRYYIALVADNDGVATQITAGGNYVIMVENGVLTINRRQITVTLGNATGQYGVQPDLTEVENNVKYSNGQLVGNDIVINNITTVANEISPRGGYTITATACNDNYDVTIITGVYTITERRISVEIVAGGGTYGDTINEPAYDKVLDDSGKDISDFVNGKLDLAFTYSGIANDGTPYNDSATMPKQAGTYIATLVGSNNTNFIIVGKPYTQFVIDKKELDGSYITFANQGQAYTGSAIEPIISEGEFANYGKDLYTVKAHTDFVNAGSYTVTLCLKDNNNYKWNSVEGAERDYTFEIAKASNKLVGVIEIANWVYGEYDATVNAPKVNVLSGTESVVTFEYATQQNGAYTYNVPATGNVGEYWVRVTVGETDNYNAFVSEGKRFEITKKALVQPSLVFITEGEGQNKVYTGEELLATVVGFDMSRMNLDYQGINVSNGQVVVKATNAGTYTVVLSLVDSNNYSWQGTTENEITLLWTIAPKAIARPTENTDTFMVNGQTLTYIPKGFDADLMTIEGNEMAYGGTFTVTVGLKDTTNYVWEDGGIDNITFSWKILGVNTVFTIVISVLASACAVALIAAGVQILLDRRKKRSIEHAIDVRSQMEESATAKEGKGGND
ncbi:MAG: hypothetical protein K2M64_00880, partial [Clostridia bacterium]|nr:hypothetical protein [Clostridia bacterium]